MGTYINIGNRQFEESTNKYYVDKSGLISVVNNTLNTENRFSCVTRLRRFGKSMAARMLCAYYDKSCDSHSIFDKLEISKDEDYEKFINKFNVIKLDITDFTTRYKNDENIVSYIQKAIQKEAIEMFPEAAKFSEGDDLMETLIKITQNIGEKFIMIIDEWDAICREFEAGSVIMDSYLNWLRRMFKGSNTTDVFAGVYLTGILPIKKFKTESALNNFREYSMVQPRQMDKYFGFTKNEVKALCEKYDMDFSEMEKWYDGYQIGNEPSMFNPSSVMQAIDTKQCWSFWASTGSFDNVSHYISGNFFGLKDDFIKMLTGERCRVNTTKFQNDMSIVRSKDDVFTVLIHLGYLAYDPMKQRCYIPNKEVELEITNAIENTDWTEVNRALYDSEELLEATLNGDEEAVAQGIEKVHDKEVSILSYNNENSLSCVLSLAYYFAKNDYIMHRELPTGKGFADIVLIPRKNVDSPALILELKFNQDAETAISQIHKKQYTGKISEYTGDILLVGINYNKDGEEGKHHTCKIERVSK